MRGLFVTFEGNEGTGKSTQIALLAERLRASGREVQVLREPGGTPIGEEIRHTLKHSPHNQAMTPEAELLLLNASRAQLVREVIRPALARGAIVLSDRFFDSTLAYQAYGRGLDLDRVRVTIDFAVGETRPDLTLLLSMPPAVREARRQARQQSQPMARDRFEEAEDGFFNRVEAGYRVLAAAEPDRIKVIDASGSAPQVSEAVWRWVAPLLPG